MPGGHLRQRQPGDSANRQERDRIAGTTRATAQRAPGGAHPGQDVRSERQQLITSVLVRHDGALLGWVTDSKVTVMLAGTEGSRKELVESNRPMTYQTKTCPLRSLTNGDTVPAPGSR